MTIYLNFQFFGKQNTFSLLKKIPLCMKLSAIMLFVFAKLLQKSEMRKDIVIELSYKGFS